MQIRKIFCQRVSETYELFRKVVLDFKPIFLTFILILVVSTVIYVVSIALPFLNDILAASPQTLWGVVTSLFTHGGGTGHLVDNMLALLAYFSLFAISNSFLSNEEKRGRISFFLIVIFLTSITSNAVCIISMPQTTTTGSSGVVFASEGVMMGFSLLNSLGILSLGKCGKQDRKLLLRTFLSNFPVFLIFFFQILLNPQLFLNVGPQVNVFVHGVAFLSSFLLAFLWYQVKQWLNTRKNLHEDKTSTFHRF